MSKHHRNHESAGADGAGSSSSRAPGKRTLTGRIPAKPRRSEAASTSLPGAPDEDPVGPEDTANLPPKTASIIDLAARDEGTQLIVAKGSNQQINLYPRASVVTPEGRKLADARIVQVNAGTTVLITRASMDVIDTNEGIVRFEDDTVS